MDYDKFDKNLILLLNIFSDRPNHLIQFLLDNDAFKQTFKNRVIKSDKLNSLKDFDSSKMDFVDFTEMNDFFSKLMDNKKSKKNIDKEMNEKLFEMIYNEDYENATKLRDYMNKIKIKIKL